MNAFYLFSFLLIGAAVLMIVLLPRSWQRRSPTETNAHWLRLRQRELEGEDAPLREEAMLRLLEDGEANEEMPGIARYALTWQLFGVTGMVALVVTLYHALGAWEDVGIAAALEGTGEAEPAEIRALIARIEARAEARPGNRDYSVLLGEYYLSGNDPATALPYYDRLLDAGVSSADILAKAAQAEFLASDRQLSGRARNRAEQALAINPAAPAALGTLGMAAFEERDFDAAIRYWERLRALEPEGSPGHQMLSQVIARARAELGESDVLDLTTPAIAVLASLPPGFTPPASAQVFVFARPEGGEQGMPIAVKRLEAASWPLSVQLDDRHSMAGQQISAFAHVAVEVQVSMNGQPGRDNAIAWGYVGRASVGTGKVVEVVLKATDSP